MRERGSPCFGRAWIELFRGHCNLVVKWGLGFRVYKLCFHCAFSHFRFPYCAFHTLFFPYSAFHTLFVPIVRFTLCLSPLCVSHFLFPHWAFGAFFLFPHCAFGAFFFPVMRLALTRECDLLFWTSILSSSSSSSFSPSIVVPLSGVFSLFYYFIFIILFFKNN